MKIALIGVTGNVGKRILDEALQRGHDVTGIAREGPVLPPRERYAFVSGDANRPVSLASVLAGHEAVISSLPFKNVEPTTLIEAVRRSRVKRYLVVGGAGSLEVTPGLLVVNSGHVPDASLDEAIQGKDFLDVLRTVKDLDWTMLSPSALFIEGERTGIFRLGTDVLLVDSDQRSWISYEDFAVALLDEVETPKHLRSRFTVGY